MQLGHAMLFNINKTVRVKVTPLGKKIYDDYWAEILPVRLYDLRKPIKEDELGWSEWQLWDLMATFGCHFKMGHDVPFETEIEIPCN